MQLIAAVINVDALYQKVGAHILSIVCNTTALPKPNGICCFLVSVMQRGQDVHESQCRTTFAVDPIFRL